MGKLSKTLPFIILIFFNFLTGDIGDKFYVTLTGLVGVYKPATMKVGSQL